MPAVEFTVDCFDEWMAVRFAAVQRCLSWAVVNGGSIDTDTVAWRFLHKDELRDVADPREYMRDAMTRAGLSHAVGMMTSRRRHAWLKNTREYSSVACTAIATIGLSNALAAGDPPGPAARPGTINLLCAISLPLNTEAALEALALAAEARAAAVIESGAKSIVSAQPATGTGTDCIVIAHPAAAEPQEYCGKHTALGHVIGAAVTEVIMRGTREWLAENAV